MLPPELPLNALHSQVIDTSKERGHTHYVLRIQPALGGVSDSELVYRRFSAFVQFHRLAHRHFGDQTYCCGGEDRCLLTPLLQPVFEAVEFPSGWHHLSFLRPNAKSVVEDRAMFLNAMLAAIEDALTRCPERVLRRCDHENCRLARLLKSFYGYVTFGRPGRAATV